MATVSEVASLDFDQPRFAELPRIYIIASQPRSGSHYLAHLLRSTGQAGVPLEYFHSTHWRSWAKRCRRDNPLASFRIMCQLRTTPNGVFGVKMHWRQFQLACRLRLEGELDGADWIQISRRDLLGQAISLVIASQTGAWIHDHRPQRSPEYSFAAIRNAIDQLIAERSNWDRFFATTGITPLRVDYEDISADRDATMRAVCEHIGIEWSPDIDLESRVQRTSLSDTWRERFLTTLPQLHETGAFWRGQFSDVAAIALDAD